MSNDFETLEYDGELTDDDPIMVIRLSRYWLDKLVGVAEVLRSRSLWNAFDDVDLALSQVDDMIVRLMGSEEDDTFMDTVLPITIPATAFYFSEDVNSTILYNWGSGFLHTLQYTDTVNSEDFITDWQVPLRAGWYVLQYHHIKGSNGGKVKISAIDHGDVMGTLDLYAPSNEYLEVESVEFEVEEDALWVFEMYRELKSGSSSGCRVWVEGITIRKRSTEEE